jgi:hypothetical protein
MFEMKEKTLVVVPPVQEPHQPCCTVANQTKNLRLVENTFLRTSSLQTLTKDPPRQPKKIPSTTKKITFDEQAKIYFTISLQEISATEREAMWYSKEEFREITRSSCRQIKQLDRGKLFKDKKYCSRGLESHMRMATQTKRKNYEMSHKVVFDEQNRQRRDCVHEMEYLSSLYHSVSSSCQLWANVVGLSDQRAAEETQQEEEDDIGHSSRSHERPPPLQQKHRQEVAPLTTLSTTSPVKLPAIHQSATILRIRNVARAA